MRGSIFKRKAIGILIAGIITAMLAFPLFGSVVQAAVVMTLTATPSVASAPVGSSFDVSVSVNNQAFSDLNGYQFNVTYDPAVIQISGTEGNPAGVGDGLIGSSVIYASAATAVPPASAAWAFVPSGVQGTLRISGNLHRSPGVNGTGYLAQLHFHVVGTYGQTSAITISGASFTNSLGGPLFDASGTIVYTSGSVSIPYPNITVSVSAPTQVGINSYFTARINISYVTDFGVYGPLDLSYDPSVLQVIGLQGDSTGVTGGYIGPTPLPVAMWATYPGGALGSPPNSGKIRILGSIPNLPSGVNGSGYLAEVHFHVVGQSGSSGLTLDSNTLLLRQYDWDYYTQSPLNLTISTVNTTVNVLTSLQVTTNSPLPSGEAGVPYNVNLTAAGGTAPYTWALQSGSLPAGLSLNSAGNISGTPASATQNPVTFTCRVTDAASNTATKDISLTIIPGPAITNNSPLPGGEVGVFYSQTLIPSGGTAPYTWAVPVGSLPAGLYLNTTTGVFSGTPTASGTSVIPFTVTDALNITGTKSLSITIVNSPSVSTSSPLPDGEVGVSYSTSLSALNGTAPYSWSIISGSLPAGLSMSLSGLISGVPTAPTGGPVTIIFQVTDIMGGTATKTLVITVYAGPTINSPSALPAGEVGIPYSLNLSAGGGTAPYTWSVISGALPNGLSLNAAGGSISGTPTVSVSASFTLKIVDSLGSAGTKSMSLTIYPVPTITTLPVLPSGEVGVPYSRTLSVSGGFSPYTWTLVSGSLPDGIGLNTATGLISGTPVSAVGPVSLAFRLNDSLGGTASATLSLTIIPSPGITSPATLPDSEIQVPYSYTLTATGGTPAYTWSIIAGALPAGLSLNPSTGVISGTPTILAAHAAITVQVVDSVGGAGTKTVTISTNSGPSIDTSSIPSGIISTPYSYFLSASSGASPYTWSIISGALPNGLSLNNSTGEISGTPTTATSPISATYKITDAMGGTATRALSLGILAGPVITTVSLTDGHVNSPYSFNLIAAGGTLPYTWTVSSGTLPSGLSLNSSTGNISGTPSSVGTATLTFRVTDRNSRYATRTMTLNIVASPIITTTSPLPSAEAGVAYSYTLLANGGTLPYSWTVASGALPSGLSLNPATGVISGTPSAGGVFTFNAQVSDNAGGTGGVSLSITVVPAPSIQSSSLPDGTVGVAYSQSILVSGGTVPYVFSITGSLPGGLSLNTATGSISGTPTSPSNGVVFTVRVSDTLSATATRDFSINITSPLSVTSSSPLPTGQVGVAYSFALSASGGKPPYSWSITSNQLPAGLSLNPSGLISGTPTSPTNSAISISFQVTDAGNQTATATLALTVASNPVISTSSPLPAGESGLVYSKALTAGGGTLPYTWSLLSGNLPAGLSLNTASGLISGTPAVSAVGVGSFTAQVSDANSIVSSKTFSITIVTSITINYASLPGGEVGVPYSYALSASGGLSPCTWSVSSGSLPPGLALNQASGGISGTPTANGTYNCTLQATDSLGGSASQSYAMVITPGPSITTASPLGTGEIGTPYTATLSATGGTPPYTWSVTSGTLPAGLSLNAATGQISGTPTAGNNNPISFTVTDSLGGSNAKSFGLTIIAPLSITTSSTLQPGCIGVAYSLTLSAVGGTLPYTWTISSGSLPDGISLNASSGMITGTPASAGNFVFNIGVSDSATPNNTQNISVTLKIYLKYDVNGNGTVNMGDVVELERIILGLDPPTPSADANRDGMINVGDIIFVERAILGIIS